MKNYNPEEDEDDQENKDDEEKKLAKDKVIKVPEFKEKKILDDGIPILHDDEKKDHFSDIASN